MRESNLILRAHDFLASLGEKVVNYILKAFFGFGNGLRTHGGIRLPRLQHINDAVADVDLIVKIFPLQLEQLPVELCYKV